MVLFVQFGDEKYPGSFKKLKSYIDPISFCNKEYYIIDNKYPDLSFTYSEDNVIKIGGDNTLYDFTGWQKGLDIINSLNVKYDIILLCNSSFEVNGKSYLENHATLPLLLRSIIFKTAIGRIDSHRRKISALDLDVSRWICTNAIFIPRPIIDTLGQIITIGPEDVDSILHIHYNDSIFKNDAPISLGYRATIINWITKQWHSKYNISPENWELTKIKIISILNEALLSARIKRSGFQIKRYGLKKYY